MQADGAESRGEKLRARLKPNRRENSAMPNSRNARFVFVGKCRAW
jgi:hypothetical protein